MNEILKERLKILLKNLTWDFFEKKHFADKKIKTDLTPDTIKYLIRRDEISGLFSYVEICMRQTMYAVRHDMFPYIDMTGCQNPYLEKSDSEKCNWWELYFEQPVVVEDTVGRKCVNCEDEVMDEEVPHSRSAVLLKRSRWYWGKVYQKYFKLNERSIEYFEREYNELFEGGKLRVLGVLMRGTDYKKAKGHPIQPDINQIVSQVKKIEKKYDKIYVASEEYRNVKALEELFPGKILVNKRQYYDGIDMSNKWINEVTFNRENDGYLKGMEYLSSIMLLSKCDGLVAGICGGSVAATYINNGRYKDLKLLYYGESK